MMVFVVMVVVTRWLIRDIGNGCGGAEAREGGRRRAREGFEHVNMRHLRQDGLGERHDTASLFRTHAADNRSRLGSYISRFGFIEISAGDQDIARIPNSRHPAASPMTRRKPIRQANAGEACDVASSSTSSPGEVQFRVLTHNIRYATNAPFRGEERWPVRCPLLCSELLFHSVNPATFVCLQEVLHSQLGDIMDALNKAGEQWAYIGVGRDDGQTAGEYSPIIYRPAVWRLKRWNTCWLSPTPRFPSKGWDAASVRIATIGQFEHSQTGQVALITTTHLDDQGAESRKRSAELLLDVLSLEASLGRVAVSILAGDFNSPPGDEAYKILTAPKSSLADVADQVPPERHYGNKLTYTGFSGESAPSRIDFILSRKTDKMERESYAVLANRFDDGVFLSDHRACVADFRLSSDAR